jgi:hypothetical protein
MRSDAYDKAINDAEQTSHLEPSLTPKVSRSGGSALAHLLAPYCGNPSAMSHTS